MSDRFDVKAGERGVVRVFSVDLPEVETKGFNASEALGVETLVPDYVELFPVEDLKGLGLAAYMHDGLGIAEEDLDTARLDGLKGYVLIVLSAAFGGAAVTLAPRAPLRWIGTYTEESAPVKFEPLPDASAQGNVVSEGKPPPSDAAISGRVAMIALLVIFALTALMVWIAG